MIRSTRFTGFLPLLLFLSSCGSTPCAKGSLSFNLIGFTDPESQHIILRKYPEGQQFNGLIDTVIVQVSFTRSNDSLTVASFQGEAMLWGGYDYEIELPVAGRLYRISRINEIQSANRHSFFDPKKDGCINTITDLRINDQFTGTVRFNQFYLRK